MPIYSFQCECGVTEEHLLKYDERDSEFTCPSCGEPMQRSPVEKFRLGKEAYQCKAILNNGDHIAGHFGKEAKWKKH